MLFLAACAVQTNQQDSFESVIEIEVTQIPVETIPSIEAVVTENETPPIQQEVPQYNDYHISLEVDTENRVINGIERIRFTNHTGTTLDTIVIRTYLNAFSESASLKPYFPRYEETIFKQGKDYATLDVLYVSTDKDELDFVLDETVLYVFLNTPLEAEETVQLLLQFDAYIPIIGHRTGANEHAMWMGMFVPVLSVHNGTNWDVSPYYPAGDPFLLETAHYTVMVTTPPEYILAGSGTKREVISEDKKVTTFSARMVRDFAFAISPDFNQVSAFTESGVEIRLYYYSDNLRIDEILTIAKNSMEYFNKTVGVYPYGHVSIVETDMFVNGMEFSKIVFMDSNYLQTTKDYASLVHELGHQWFYNVVGNNPITEAWLDEGMTLYVQEAFFHENEQSFQNKMQNEYNTFKTLNGSWVIGHDLSMFNNWRNYYLTHYSKAKLMLYALHIRMGDEAFWQCIGQYYQTYSFRIAATADFISIAEEVHGMPLCDFFDEWLYGENLPEI
jgi:hypothetical protein